MCNEIHDEQNFSNSVHTTLCSISTITCLFVAVTQHQHSLINTTLYRFQDLNMCSNTRTPAHSFTQTASEKNSGVKKNRMNANEAETARMRCECK